MAYRAGLDWGDTAHAICVIDDAGRVVDRLEVEHTAEGIKAMLARLRRLAPPAELPIAIERPSGPLVEALLAAGHPVVPIHPNVVKACRPRYGAAGSKSDPGDAYILADILRTDGHRFRPLDSRACGRPQPHLDLAGVGTRENFGAESAANEVHGDGCQKHIGAEYDAAMRNERGDQTLV